MVVLQRHDDLEADWVDIGVDDLTKYRIVEYLYQQEGDGAEVQTLATSLGFHSLEQTTATVEELYRSGLIWMSWDEGRPDRCGLTADPIARGTVAELFSLGRVTNSTSDLLARLARRSLDRARARRPGRRGQPIVELFLPTG